jgi:hypothetical protein
MTLVFFWSVRFRLNTFFSDMEIQSVKISAGVEKTKIKVLVLSFP